MSIHPSLKSEGKLKAKRTVLKRRERIQWLMKKKEWDETKSVLGLPKIKMVKIKTSKKEKKEEGKEEKQTAKK